MMMLIDFPSSEESMHKIITSIAFIGAFLGLLIVRAIAAETPRAPITKPPNVASPPAYTGVISRPMTTQERAMWDEYLLATKPGTAAAALQAWATKHNVQLTAGNRMSLGTRVISGGLGVSPPGIATPETKCSDVCSPTANIYSPLDRARTVVYNCTKLASCYYDKEARGWRCNYTNCTVSIQVLQ